MCCERDSERANERESLERKLIFQKPTGTWGKEGGEGELYVDREFRLFFHPIRRSRRRSDYAFIANTLRRQSVGLIPPSRKCRKPKVFPPLFPYFPPYLSRTTNNEGRITTVGRTDRQTDRTTDVVH